MLIEASLQVPKRHSEYGKSEVVVSPRCPIQHVVLREGLYSPRDVRRMYKSLAKNVPHFEPSTGCAKTVDESFYSKLSTHTLLR